MAETVELQLAGCVLVAVLSRVELLESKGVQDFLTELMYVLKLPSNHPAFVLEWHTKFRMHFATNRYVSIPIFYVFQFIFTIAYIGLYWLIQFRSSLVFKGLQQFWCHMARKDRVHFDVLLLLREVSDNPSLDMFEVIGCRRSVLLNIVTKAM